MYRVGICNEHGDCGDCGDCGDGLFLILETLDWGVLCTSEVLCIHWELCCGTCTHITRFSSTVWLGIARIFVFSQYYLEIHCDGVDCLPSTVCNTWSPKFHLTLAAL